MAIKVDGKQVDMYSAVIEGRGCNAYYSYAYFMDGVKLTPEQVDILNEVSNAQEVRYERKR